MPFWGSRKKDQTSNEGQRSPQSPPTPEAPRSVPSVGAPALASWEARLAGYEAAHDAVQYAQFHQQALIIGFGDITADIFDILCDRMDDTNTFETSLRPFLLHLALPNIDETRSSNFRRPKYSEPQSEASEAIVQSVILNERPTTPIGDEVSRRHWRWLSPFGSAPHLNRRVASRIALYNHLMLGVATSLRLQLDHYRQLIETSTPLQVYLVVSALDAASGMIGDLAALIRIVFAHSASLSISALVLENDSSNCGSGYRDPGSRLATLLELSSYTSYNPISFALPGRLNWNPQLEHRSLLNGAILFQGECGVGRVEVAHFLWGMLTSSTLHRDVLAKIDLRDAALARTPTISLGYVHAAVLPLRFLRQMVAVRLTRLVIGEDLVPGINTTGLNLQDDHNLTTALETARPYGLLPWIRYYAAQRRTPYSEKWVLAVRGLRQQMETAQRNHSTRFDNYLRYAQGVELPIRLQDWKDFEGIPPTAKANLLARIGFFRAGGMLKLGVADRKPIITLIGDPSQIEEAFLDAERLINRVAGNYIQPYTQQLLAQFERNQMAKNVWLSNFQTWQQRLHQRVRGSQLPENARWFNFVMNVDWSRPDLGIQNLTAQDQTSALQVTLFPRVPLRALNEEQGGFLREQLADAAQRITCDLVGQTQLGNVPLALREALAHIEPMCAFVRWWQSGDWDLWTQIRDAIHAQDWEQAVWIFIRIYETSPDDDEIRRLPATDQTIGVPPRGSEFAQHLAIILEKLSGDNTQPAYYRCGPGGAGA